VKSPPTYFLRIARFKVIIASYNFTIPKKKNIQAAFEKIQNDLNKVIKNS